MLTLAQLKTFDCIARLGSFGAAARELGLTQPSISQRVRELELALGTKLFIRHGPRISLSAEGHALVGHARSLLDDASAVVERFRGRDPLRGLLRLGLSESFALICLPDLLQRLQAQHPHLRTSVEVGNAAEIGRLLNERRLDIGIVSEADVEPHVQALPIGLNRLGWFAGRDLVLPRKPLSPLELARYHLIITPPDARLHTTAMSWFAQGGATPGQMSFCNNLPVTILTILKGLAVGLVPVRLMAEHVRQRTVRHVTVHPAMGGHRVSLCYQANEFGPKLQQVIDLAHALIDEKRLFESADAVSERA